MVRTYLKSVWFWLVVLPLLYSLSGFVLLPWLMRTQLPPLLKEKFNLNLVVEDITFNPFSYELHVKNLSLLSNTNERVISMNDVYVDYEPSALLKKELVVKAFLINQPFIHPQLDTNGTLNFITLFAPLIPQEKTTTPTNNERSMPFTIEHFELQDAKGKFTDFRTPTPFVFDFGPLFYTINNLSFDKDDLSIHALKIALENQEKITLASSVTFEPFKIHGELNLKHFPLPFLWNYLMPTIPAILKEGSFSARLPFTLDLSKETLLLSLDKANIQLNQLAFYDRQQQKLIAIPTLSVEEIDFHWPESTVRLGTLNIFQPFVALALEKEYAINLTTLFMPPTPSQTPTHTQEKASSSTPWHFDLQKLHIEGGLVELLDRNTNAEKTLFSDLTLEAKGLSNDANTSINYTLSSRIDTTGLLLLSGSFHVPSQTLETTIDAQALPLIKAKPYLASLTPLILTHGTLFTQSTLHMSFKEALALTFKGEVTVDKFNVDDAPQRSLLAWDKLALSEVAYTTHPASLHVKKIGLIKPYLNLDIKKDKTTNFTNLLTNTPSDSKDAKQDEAFEVRIGEMTLKEGTATFKDASLPIPFSTFIHRLNGTFSALDTKSTKPSVLKLEGKVDKYGYTKVGGSLLPFDFKNRANLSILFKNIDMPSLSPYSGKFIGYTIKQGKLTMDLNYKIKKGLMEGDNKINLDSLTLGEKIESDDATNLPLGLAIAILKDAKGQIDLDLPVSGDLNDPDFKYGAIVWKAIGNLLGSIVTSPFSLLGSLLGIETENLKSIDFVGGEYELIASEEEKMEQYKQILDTKPELKLSITPSFNEALDTRFLQEKAINNLIETSLAKTNKQDDSYGKILKELFVQKFSKKDYETFENEMKEQKMQRGEINQTLKEKLFQSIVVTQEELHTLAHKRADAIITYMTQKYTIPTSRLIKADLQPSDALREKWVGCAIGISN